MQKMPDPYTYPTMDEPPPIEETPDDPDEWRSAMDEPE